MFARAIAMMAMIQSNGVTETLAKMGDYVSRGKGLGKHSGKKWGVVPSGADMTIVNGKWRQKENGAREMARRRLQVLGKSAYWDPKLEAKVVVL